MRVTVFGPISRIIMSLVGSSADARGGRVLRDARKASGRANPIKGLRFA